MPYYLEITAQQNFVPLSYLLVSVKKKYFRVKPNKSSHSFLLSRFEAENQQKKNFGLILSQKLCRGGGRWLAFTGLM